jgi:hypothetical protein
VASAGANAPGCRGHCERLGLDPLIGEVRLRVNVSVLDGIPQRPPIS